MTPEEFEKEKIRITYETDKLCRAADQVARNMRAFEVKGEYPTWEEEQQIEHARKTLDAIRRKMAILY